MPDHRIFTVDLCCKLQDEQYADGGDVKAHLMKLQTIREDLIATGTDPGDKDFVAIVLGSLPIVGRRTFQRLQAQRHFSDKA